jgi:phosphatidylglycerophosphate synthase
VAAPGWLVPVPNVISGARLAAVPLLVALAWLGIERAYGMLLVGALVSDIVDGLIARGFRITSPLGASLDSTADALLLPTAAFGVWTFHRPVIVEYRFAFGLVVGLWIADYVLSLWRYGRLSSFHTYLSRAAAYAMGFLVGGLFVFGFARWLLWLAFTLGVAASLENFALLWLLPTWQADVRGVLWVLRARAETRCAG